MVPSMFPSVQRSLSSTSLNQLALPPSHAHNRHRPGATRASMGPVSASVVLYVASRLLSRIYKGQLMRKGVYRKLRRMSVLLLDYHLVYEMVLDCLDRI